GCHQSHRPSKLAERRKAIAISTCGRIEGPRRLAVGWKAPTISISLVPERVGATIVGGKLRDRFGDPTWNELNAPPRTCGHNRSRREAKLWFTGGWAVQLRYSSIAWQVSDMRCFRYR